MKRKMVLLAVAGLYLSIEGAAQVSTGTPFMASIAGGPEAINLGNLNINWTFPMISKPGRGMPFVLSPTLDSSIWYPVTSGSTKSWQPISTFGWSGLPSGYDGYVTYQTSTSSPYQCGQPINGNNYYYEFFINTFTNFVYVDAHGTPHPFSFANNPYYIYLGQAGCQSSVQAGPGPSESASATDGSGYSIEATPSSQYGVLSSVSNSSGIGMALGSSTTVQEDIDGNLITCASSGCTDTLNTTVTSVAGTPGNPPITITATGPSGPVYYKINFSSYTVKTSFNCPNVSEYGPTAISLPSSIVLPDGRQYVITYESTPGFSGDVTGRVVAITLPSDSSGPTVQYVYSGGGSGVNGIECSDGSTPTLKRTTPDGQWTYARSQSGSVWTTLITAPAISGVQDQTQVQFLTGPTGQTPVNFYEIGRQAYSGSTTGTLLETVLTCYQSSSTGCRTNYTSAYTDSGGQESVINSTLAQTVMNQYPNSSGVTSGYTDQYFSGLLSQHEVYDFGAVGSGTFSSNPIYIHGLVYEFLTNLYDATTQVTIADKSELAQDYVAYLSNGQYATVAFTENNFDETPPIASGAAGRSSGLCPSGGCAAGNITSTYQWVSGGNPITSCSPPNHLPPSCMSGMQYLNTSNTYYDTGVVSVATDVNGGQTTYSYGSGSCNYAFPTSVSTQTGGSVVTSLSTSSTWNCSGAAQLTATDVNGNQTTYGYGSDPFWRVASVTNNVTGQVTNYSYPTASSPTSSSSMAFLGTPATSTSVSTFDRLGRTVVQQQLQGPGSTNYDSVATSYDARGRQSFQTLPYQGTLSQLTLSGPGVTTSYDALNRTSSVGDSGGGSTTYTYTMNDVLVAAGPAPSGENLKQRTLEYDGAGWLSSVCEIVTSSTMTPPGGPCAQSTSHTGYLTSYSRYRTGWLYQSHQNAQSGSTGTQTRTVSRDGLGRKVSEAIPEWSAGNGSSGSTAYTYDSDSTCGSTSKGDLIKTVDNDNNVTCYTYDKLHRLLSSTVISGPYQTATPASYYVYDAATCNNTSMQNAKGALAEAYTGSSGSKITDECFSNAYSTSGATSGGVVSTVWESTPNFGGYFQTADTFYPNGVLGARTSTAGLPNIAYGVDGEGRPITTSDSTNSLNLVTATSYNPASMATGVNFGNGDSDSFVHDSSTYRPTSLLYTVTGGSPFTVTTNLTWNPNWSLNQMHIADTNDSTKNQTCTYSADDLKRLASVSCGTSTWAQNFTYDPFGNINKANAGNATSYPAAYNAVTNQVSSGISPLPGYDKNGNQLSSTGLDSISWNAAANPVSITPLSGSAIAGTYDAFGRLVAITSGGTTKQFIYAPQGDKYAVIQGGALAKETVSLPGGETAIYNTTSGPPYIRHTDWLGSSRLATTWAHAVYSKESYAPFGETYNEAGTADRSFTGQDQDTVTGSAATGIYDFLFRKYDPAAGRWLSPDPAGWQVVDQADPKSLNRYAYVENMPMTFVDLDGRSCVANNVYDGSGNLVSVSYVDDGDGQGCAAAGVAPGPNGTNDGTPGVTANGNPSCNGNPNCVVVNPPPDCGFQCLLDYSSVITQLQNSGEQVYVLPLQGQSGAAPSKGQTWKEFGQAAKSCAASSFGLSTAAAGGAVAAGTNALSTAGKFAGMTPGTSAASSFFRAILPQAIESTWAPTLMNPLATSGVLGGVVGRWVPVVGEAILVVQGGNFVSCLWASDDNY
jgi:RHS repeat-associated protein